MPTTSGRPKKALLLFAEMALENNRAYPEDLIRLLNESGQDMTFYWGTFEQLAFFMSEDAIDVIDIKNDRSLTEYDVVYFRYWGDAQGAAMAAARFCSIQGIPFTDSETHRTGSFNKITQYMNLYEAHVPFPRTVVAPAQYLVDHYGQYDLSFPLVMKSVGGTRGRDNYVAEDEDAMKRILDENPNVRFVTQTFIPNNGDYRIVVMGDKVTLAIERKASSGTHLNNTSQGGSAVLVSIESLPQTVLDLSIQAARFFGREIAGVDMVHSLADGRYYCFEVNRAPQIERASFEHEKAHALYEYLLDIAQ